MNSNYGIYIHIPFCKARCGYCAFSSCCDYALQQTYFDKLFAEIVSRSNRDVKISTIYLGGGTPSSVESHYIDKLFSTLSQHFNLANVSEISVECNPESVTDELLVCLKRNNVNRLSFGLQSCSDETLSKIGRIHRYADFVNALNLAQKYGFINVNADLIIGLPEPLNCFKQSVDTVAQLPLTHISVYALELHENSPVYNLCKTHYNYDDDTLADMYDYAVSTLQRNGFNRYEISNFAKQGCECKHNLNYWNEGRYFAFGAAASGFVGNCRYTNPFDIKDYISTPTGALLKSGDELTLDEQANEYDILRLRLDSGADIDEFKRRFNADFFDFFPNAERLVKQGYIVVNGSGVRVPSDKLYVVNAILTELLTF